MAINNRNNQIDITYNIRANTRDAVQSFRQLSDTLKNTMNDANFGKGITRVLQSELQEANRVVGNLRSNLESAFNIKTGTLNFTDFTKNMQNSGYAVKDYVASLNRLGPAGEQAFQQLAHAVLNSEIQLKRAHPILNKFIDSLSRVALYQFSTRALSLFTQGLREAYQFTQDLNESLNKIRIVTKASAEEMADFAIKANQAAQALSSTTTAYTDASLIYFQQGLSEEEAIARTNVTLKLANVTGESVKAISNDLTAIWNNFDNGSKSLEYYADVMTKLGATTASSSKEIATGLEKFAPIAQTVGLSYEYAAAALATVSAETRTSAEVVGTAFKTIFGRLDSLKLGKTLEDDVGLTKYTAALESVGVSVMDTNGELRQMDDILDDIGEVWATINDSQKAALANTVAGVRQYAQFMALMNNWDTVKLNVEVAAGSEGELQEQQEVYAESWDAAAARVKDTLQSIYMMLLNDNSFIDMINGLNEVLKVVKNIVKGLGGLPGILATVANLVLSIKNDVIATKLGESFQNMWLMSKQGRQYQADQRNQIIGAYAKKQDERLLDSGFLADKSDTAAITRPKQVLEEQLELKRQLAAQNKTLSQADQDRLKYELEYAETLADEKVKLSQQKEELVGVIEQQQRRLSTKTGAQATSSLGHTAVFDTYTTAAKIVNTKNIGNSSAEFSNIRQNFEKELQKIEQLFGSDNTAVQNIRKKFSEILQFNPEEANASKDKILKLFDDIKSELNSKPLKMAIDEKGAKEALDRVTDSYISNNTSNQVLSSVKDGLSAAFKTGVNYDELLNMPAFKSSISTMQESLKMVFEGDFSSLSKETQQALKDLFSVSNGDELKSAVEKVNTALELTDDDAIEAKKQLLALTDDSVNVETLAAGVQNINNNLKNQIDLTNKHVASVKADHEAHQKMLTSAQKNYKQLGQQMTNTARILTSITQCYSAIKGFISAINDEDMSFGDKLAAVMGALGSAIMAVTSVLTIFSTAKVADAGASATAAAGNTALAGSMIAAGEAGTVGATGVSAFAAASTAALGPVGIVIAIIAALVAVVLGVIEAVKHFNKEAERVRPENILRGLSNEADEVNSQLQELAENSKAFADTAERYDGLIEKLDTLGKYTTEYRDTLQEALGLQNDLIKNSTGLQYLINNYASLGIAYSDIFDAEGKLTEYGRQLGETYTQQIQKDLQVTSLMLAGEQGILSKQIKNSKEDSNEIANFVNDYVKLHNSGSINTSTLKYNSSTGSWDIDSENLASVSSYLSHYTNPEDGSLNETFWLKQTDDIIQLAKQHGIKLAQNEAQAVLTAIVEGSEAGLLAALQVPMEQSSARVTAQESFTKKIQDVFSDYYSADTVESLVSTVLNIADEEELKAYRTLGTADFINKQKAEYIQRLEKKSGILKQDQNLIELLKERKIIIDDDLNNIKDPLSTAYFDRATNEIVFKVNKKDAKEQKISIWDLFPKDEEFVQALSEYVPKTGAKSYNDLYAASEDYTQLTEKQVRNAIDLMKLVGKISEEEKKFYEDNLFTDLAGDESFTIGERSQLYSLQQEVAKKSEEAANDLNNISIEEQQALLKLISDGTINAANNLELFAKAMGTSVGDINDTTSKILQNLQTVGLSYVQEYSKNLGEYNNLLNKVYGGNAIDQSDLDMLGKILPNAKDYFNVSVDDKTGEISYSLDDFNRKQFDQQVAALGSASLSISGGKGWDIKDFNALYGSTNGSLKSILALHRQIDPLVRSEAAAAKEESIYKSAFNTALQAELDAIKVTRGEWLYLKEQFKDQGVSDEDLLIYVKFKASKEDLKETFDDWADEDFQIDSSNRFNLQHQIAEIFSVEDEEAAKLFEEDGIENILKPLFSGTEEEAKEAWDTIQEYFKKQTLEANIATIKMSGDQPHLANFLQDLLDEWNSTPEFNLADKFNDKAWVQQMTALINSGETTMSQLQAIFSRDFGFELIPTYKTVEIPDYMENVAHYIVDGETDPTKAVIQKKKMLTGFTTKKTGGSTVGWDGTFEDKTKNKGTKTSLYESQRKDISLRYQNIKDELEDLDKDAEELRKKLDLTISINLSEDETKYEEILQNRISLLEKLEEKSKEYYNSDKQGAIDAYNKVNELLGGGLANLFTENGELNEQDLEDTYVDLMNAKFAGVAKESAEAVEKAKEELDYFIEALKTSQDESEETAEKLKQARQELEKWQRFDKYLDLYNTKQRLINAALADQENRMKNVNREAQHLEKEISSHVGTDKLAYIDQYIDLLHQQTEELEKQNDINRRSVVNIVEELTAFNTQYNLTIDLTNLTEDRLVLEEEVAEVLKNQFETLWGQEISEEEINALVEEYLAKIKEANNLIQSIADNNESVWGNEAQEQAKNYEKLVEKLNHQLTKTRNELTLISYQFSTLSSNFYTMGEAAALFGDQGTKYLDNLEAYASHYAELQKAFHEDGAISQKDFADGLQQVFDGIMENLDSIEQLDQQVKSYYGQTLQAANAELNAHTAGLARATSTLNHYLSVMQMINRKTDYASLGKVYEGLVKTTKNEYDVAVANYEMLKEQEERAKKDLEQYEGDKTSKAFEIANQKWQDAAAAMDQAYSDMLSKMEAWTQAIVDNFHNTLEKLKQEFEDTMTEGSNFDSVIKQLQRLKTANEEYLTRTNQIYEVNKLAREAEKEMDSQTNAVTKQRLGNFINETNALKDKNKLSNLELEIQKAKYDLLLAEMAIEDARANKNKVRLQRDSEGGYGYVYTAEAEEVSDAIQKYEDAENRLYNIGLENTEKYMEKSYQLAQQMTEELAQVWEDYNSGKIQSEQERDQEILRIEQDFQTKSLAYEELYAIAMNETHEKVVEDSWTSQVKMIGNSEKWSAAMHSYVDKVRLEFKHYEEDLTAANEHVGETAEVTAGKVGEIVTESDNLTTSILGEDGLLKALGLELDTVAGLVEKYEAWRQKIQPIIDQMYDMAEGIAAVLSAMNGTTQGANGEYIEDYSVEMFKNKSRIAELQKMAPTNEEAAKQLEEALAYEQFLKENREIKRVTNGMSEYDEATVEAIYDILASHGMQDVIEGIENGDVYLKDIVKKYKELFELYSIESYSTGGYTGDWSDSGKLGILHQKELVLNAEDTQNILSAVGMVRQMDQLLEGFSFGQGLTPGAMQQLVTIHAEFPNVQDHNEIELALNDLVNRASQYVMER